MYLGASIPAGFPLGAPPYGRRFSLGAFACLKISFPLSLPPARPLRKFPPFGSGQAQASEHSRLVSKSFPRSPRRVITSKARRLSGSSLVLFVSPRELTTSGRKLPSYQAEKRRSFVARTLFFDRKIDSEKRMSLQSLRRGSDRRSLRTKPSSQNIGVS